MNENIFKKWDATIDTSEISKQVKEVEQGGGNITYEEVPHGVYEVRIENMELKESKKGSPMVTIWFKVLEGTQKNRLIFMNQVIEQAFQIHIVNELLRKLCEGTSGLFNIEFTSYQQYGDLILNIHEHIADNFEYALNYDQNAKGYNTFEITEVFTLEDAEPVPF